MVEMWDVQMFEDLMFAWCMIYYYLCDSSSFSFSPFAVMFACYVTPFRCVCHLLTDIMSTGICAWNVTHDKRKKGCCYCDIRIRRTDTHQMQTDDAASRFSFSTSCLWSYPYVSSFRCKTWVERQSLIHLTTFRWHFECISLKSNLVFLDSRSGRIRGSL